MTLPIPQNAYLVANGSGTLYPTVFFSRPPSPFDFSGLSGQMFQPTQRWVNTAHAVSANITGATNANPCVLTAVNTFSVGQIIFISGVGGMIELNGKFFTITAVTGTTITLNVDSTGFGVYTSGGVATAQEPQEYILLGFITLGGFKQANWALLAEAGAGGGGGPPIMETLTGDSGTASPVAGNIFVYGNTAPFADTGLTFTGTADRLTLSGTLVVPHGGTGDTSFTPFAVICGGITSTNPLQSIASVGTAGQVLTSNGPGMLPTFQAGSGVFLSITFVVGPITYTVLTTDEYLSCNSTGGAITIKLPDAPPTGRVIYIKDASGTAGTNNITLTTVGGAVNIDGMTSQILDTKYQSVDVIFDGTTYEIF